MPTKANVAKYERNNSRKELLRVYAVLQDGIAKLVELEAKLQGTREAQAVADADTVLDGKARVKANGKAATLTASIASQRALVKELAMRWRRQAQDYRKRSRKAAELLRGALHDKATALAKSIRKAEAALEKLRAEHAGVLVKAEGFTADIAALDEHASSNLQEYVGSLDSVVAMLADPAFIADRTKLAPLVAKWETQDVARVWLMWFVDTGDVCFAKALTKHMPSGAEQNLWDWHMLDEKELRARAVAEHRRGPKAVYDGMTE